MWICSNCNNENSDQDLYCINCGQKKPSSQSITSGSYAKYDKFLMTKDHTFDPYKTPIFYIAIALYAIAYIFVLIAACMLGDKTSIIHSIFFLVAILTCIGINVVSKDVGMSLFFIVIGISEVVNAIITLASTGEGIYFLSLLLAVAMLALAVISAVKIRTEIRYGFAKGLYIGISIVLIVGGIINAINNFSAATQIPDIIDTGRGYDYELPVVLRKACNLLGFQGVLIFLCGVLALIYVVTEIKKQKYFFKAKEKAAPVSAAPIKKEPENIPNENSKDPAAMLSKLKDLLNQNLITQEEYEEKRKKYIDML